MEILFKAKRKDTKEWAEGYPFPSIAGKELNRMTVFEPFPGGTVVNTYEIDTNTVCRYTELRDCKGKPIFENDIVTIENTKKQGLPGVIVYNRISASFELAREGYNSIRLDYFEDGKSEFVVIGNVFDKEG